MPFIQVEILKGRTREKKMNMITGMTDAVAEALEIPKDAVKIIVREMEHDDYAVAGVPWSENKDVPYKV